MSIFRIFLLTPLALIGLGALALGGLIAAPLSHPPLLASIQTTARAADRSGMPPVSRFKARDGAELAYRYYAPKGPSAGRIAILAHGSSALGAAMHTLAAALAEQGVAAYAPDMRGHGQSGPRGDIAYIGQLEDDLADLTALIRKSDASSPITLIGHSAGGGFALRVAASPIQDLFARTILLAPYLGYDAPTSRENSGGWASPDIARIIGISVLERLGIGCCGGLPVLAFAVGPDAKELTGVYSYRMLKNYAVHGDYRADLAAATRPITIYSGAEDELMFADEYADAMRGAGAKPDVRLIADLNHMAIVSDAGAVARIAADVAGK